MCTFADCNAELAETDVRCIQCGRLRPHMASRDIVIKSRAELQQIYDQVLSHHGAVLPDSELLPEHSVVLINIRLPDGEGVIRVTGAVVGHADKPERAEAPYDIFFQLLDLDEDKQEIIQLIAAEPASAKPPEAVVAPEVLEVPDEPDDPSIDDIQSIASSFLSDPPSEDSEPETFAQLASSIEEELLSELPEEDLAVSEPEDDPLDLDLDVLPEFDSEEGLDTLPEFDAVKDLDAPPEFDADEEMTEIEQRLAELLQAWEAPEGFALLSRESALPEFHISKSRPRLPEELSNDLTDFVLEFIKAIAKTAYYTSEHQEADKAKEKIFPAFIKLLGDRPEITLCTQVEDQNHTILVYGVFDEPTRLSSVMLQGTSELYLPKIRNYFETNLILSISFKQGLSLEQFDLFIDLLGDPRSHAEEGDVSFAQKLVHHNLQSISVVFMEDRLAGRKLNWRVDMALTRLRKDLSMVPMYQNLSEEQLDAVQLQVYSDVIGGLRDAHLVREFLENCDLILSAPGESEEEIREFEKDLAVVEGRILDAIEDAVIPELLRQIADEIVIAKCANEDERVETLLRFIRRLAKQLEGEMVHVLEDVFREMVECKMLSVEELPLQLQEKFAVERKAHEFTEIEEGLFSQLEEVAVPAKYQEYLTLFEVILPELLAQRNMQPVIDIIKRLHRHENDVGAGFEERAMLAGRWRKKMLNEELDDDLVREVETADRVKREALFEVFEAFGVDAWPLLFRGLRESENPSIRQAICEFLKGFRETTLGVLTTEISVYRTLTEEDVSAQYALDLLHLIPAVGDPSSADLTLRFLDHPSRPVRLEAFQAACALNPETAEALAVSMLSHRDLDMQKLAVKELFQLECATAGFFGYCRSAIENLDEADRVLAREICRGLGAYRESEARDKSIQMLLSIFKDEKVGGAGWMSAIKSSLEPEPDHVPIKVAACNSLGELGATTAVDLLRHLKSSRSALLKQAAIRAKKRIEEHS